jgi:hypothetical protein
MAELDLDIDFGDDDPLDGLGASGKSSSSLSVTTVSGHDMPVQEANERSFYEGLRDRYIEAYIFTDPSDIADLDRILSMELTCYRLQRQLGQGHDQHGIPLGTRDISALNRTLRDSAALLGKAKDDLGMSKVAREGGDAEDPAVYLADLRRRALAFGLHRNKQVNQAIAELKEIFSVVGTYNRSNEAERAQTRYRTPEDILEWITGEVRERFEEMDRHFRENEQQIWIGKI